MDPPTLAVSTDQLDELRGILASHAKGRQAWAYGSRVRTALQTRPLKPFSDLDIALDGTALSLEEWSNLRTAMSDSHLPFRVDITLRSDLPSSWSLDWYALN
jgi:hypothetical protein